MIKTLKTLLILLSLAVTPLLVHAQETTPINTEEIVIEVQKYPEILFFYSQTCPHCAKEKKFLDSLQEKYPTLTITRYEVHSEEGRKLSQEAVKKYQAERYAGLVPLTFVGTEYFVGFDSETGVGQKIEDALLTQATTSTTTIAAQTVTSQDGRRDSNTVELPFLGSIDTSTYSLGLLAVVLGFFDGFNVCSLGALILILSLVLSLKSRKKVLLYGGLFLAITAVTYGALIFAWYKIFDLFIPYIKTFEILIGIAGIIGGIYFFRQYLRFRKFGPTCDISSSTILSRITTKVTEIFHNPKTTWVALSGCVIFFSFIITLVEFPCSATIPVFFASILAHAQISAGSEMLYLLIFMLFYLLDEIIIFAIGAWSMKIWMSSPKSAIKIVLAQSIVFVSLGLFYIIRLL